MLLAYTAQHQSPAQCAFAVAALDTVSREASRLFLVPPIAVISERLLREFVLSEPSYIQSYKRCACLQRSVSIASYWTLQTSLHDAQCFVLTTNAAKTRMCLFVNANFPYQSSNIQQQSPSSHNVLRQNEAQCTLNSPNSRFVAFINAHRERLPHRGDNLHKTNSKRL